MDPDRPGPETGRGGFVLGAASAASVKMGGARWVHEA
jgi:hypothetical protein